MVVSGQRVDDVFDTPKPEGLIRRILEIATNPGDWVLDTFAGSRAAPPTRALSGVVGARLAMCRQPAPAA